MNKEDNKNTIEDEVKSNIGPIDKDDLDLAFETNLTDEEQLYDENGNVEQEKDCEFICSGCFLVYHKNQIGKTVGKNVYCKNCADQY